MTRLYCCSRLCSHMDHPIYGHIVARWSLIIIVSSQSWVLPRLANSLVTCGVHSTEPSHFRASKEWTALNSARLWMNLCCAQFVLYDLSTNVNWWSIDCLTPPKSWKQCEAMTWQATDSLKSTHTFLLLGLPNALSSGFASVSSTQSG